MIINNNTSININRSINPIIQTLGAEYMNYMCFALSND